MGEASPDHSVLVNTLMTLRNRPDGLGETYINGEEAARIRACGFAARANTMWRAPLLPDELVRGNPWLDHLSNQYDEGFRGGWHPRRATACHITPVDPLSKFERRLIERLREAPGQHLDRRALKRTYWRRGAWSVDRTIELLLAKDHITEHGGFLYPYSRAAFRALLEAQSRPRRPVPVSTFW